MKTIYTLAIYLLLGTTISFACNCDDIRVRKSLKMSETVFIGKVIKITKNDYMESTTDSNGKKNNFEYSLYEFEFEISEVFKGEIKTKTIRITTSGTEDDCGGYYLENKSYLI